MKEVAKRVQADIVALQKAHEDAEQKIQDGERKIASLRAETLELKRSVKSAKACELSHSARADRLKRENEAALEKAKKQEESWRLRRGSRASVDMWDTRLTSRLWRN